MQLRPDFVQSGTKDPHACRERTACSGRAIDEVAGHGDQQGCDSGGESIVLREWSKEREYGACLQRDRTRERKRDYYPRDQAQKTTDVSNTRDKQLANSRRMEAEGDGKGTT